MPSSFWLHKIVDVVPTVAGSAPQESELRAALGHWASEDTLLGIGRLLNSSLVGIMLRLVH